MSDVYALVDCNNFFVSCERAFQPALERRPVVVLSSNDGCVISRSQEAKDLGVPMGIPYFKWKDLLEKDKVHVFSSNFELYGDMSDRVMQSLQQYTDSLEVYSIDEAFLRFDEKVCTREFALTMRHTVQQWTKIPISIGIGPTKVLAKVASHFAKKQKELGGVCTITLESIDEYLSTMPIGEVWGIGRASVLLLTKNRIHTALDLQRCSDDWVKKNLTVRGLEIVRELRGQPCFELDDTPTPKKGLVCSRSFGKSVTSLDELREAIVTYTTTAARKLREEGQVAGYVYVFIRTSIHSGEKQFTAQRGVVIPTATSYTPELIRITTDLLQQLYQKGYRYRKAGVGFTHLGSQNQVQQNLFTLSLNTSSGQALMRSVDRLNRRYGDQTVQYAGAGINKLWQVKKELISQRFTTSFDELPKAS